MSNCMHARNFHVLHISVQEVFFTDFLLADILTSLAKPLADMGLMACHFMSGKPLPLSIANGFDPGAPHHQVSQHIFCPNDASTQHPGRLCAVSL